LLKEAIADAKAVKETAIANAKAALEEAFTPLMQEKFAKKIAQLDEEETELEEAYEMEEGEEKEMQEMYDVEEAEAKSTDSMEEGELDLEELLRELDEMEENINMTEFPDEAGEHGNIGGQNVNEAEEAEEGEEEEEEIDLENMSEDDLKSFIESVIADMVAAGELEGNIEGGEEGEEEESEEEEVKINETEMKKEEKMEEAFDPSVISLSPEEFMQAVKLAGATISGLIGGGAAVANKEEIGAALKGAFEKVKGKLSGKSSMAKTEMEEMKSELEEAYNTIKTIKEELSEVNLFNAKLLYTNKIFKSKNLTESQKVKVLAAFDKAASVKEAKLVFETLSEGFKETKKTVNESLLVGSASKPAGVAAKKPIMEVNDQFARWQKLAGIK
jgi:hypothetical protein